MKYKVENDFAKHVKSPEMHSVYLLHGSQTYLIALYEKLLVKKALSGEFNDFNYHKFEGQNLNLQAFYDAVESLPFFSSGNRCVTLDAELDRLDAGEMKDLCDLLADPPDTTTIVITVKAPPSKKEKLTQLVKVCDKAGAVVELNARTNTDLSRFLRDRAQKSGCELPGDCASYLIERCGDDMQLLAAELDKLCAYAGGGRITREQIDAVASVVMQARVYDLSKAIFRGNFTRAMELVDVLFYLREPAPKVLAALSGAFVDLYRGYAARQANVPAGRAAGELGYPKNREFAIKNAMSDSAGYTAPQIGRMLEVLVQADFTLKSSSVDDRTVIEETIAKLFLLTEKHG